MKYELAIFDMDGTILDTLEDLKNALNYSLEHHGYPTRSLDEVRRFVGNGIRRLITLGAPEGTSEESVDKIFSDFNDYYKIHSADNTKTYPGILELIDNLQSDGIKTAVVSNKADYAVQDLCAEYFPGCFDAQVGEREGIRRKPAPDSVNEVLRKLAVSKEQAVYIGDSEVDVATAQNAGMDLIGVEWGFRGRELLAEKGAKIIVERPEEIEQIING